MDNICIYFNNRVLGEVRTSEFSNQDGKSKRVSFAISSQRPDSNGLYVKIYCHAFDKAAEDILKLNLQDGDIITAVVEHKVFKKGAGVIENCYRVLSVVPVKLKRKSESSTNNSNSEESSEQTPTQTNSVENTVTNENHVQLNAFMDVLTGGLFSQN